MSLSYFISLDKMFFINSLKNCEPEFLISTPERLLELISLKAIDISGVSLLVMFQSVYLLCNNTLVSPIQLCH